MDMNSSAGMSRPECCTKCGCSPCCCQPLKSSMPCCDPSCCTDAMSGEGKQNDACCQTVRSAINGKA